MMDGFDNAIIIDAPATIKARIDGGGRRIIECEASNENRDGQNDVILQSALLRSAKSFVNNGHIDIDHYSELGARLGIANPLSYIIGRPLEVKAVGKSTYVAWECSKGLTHDPERNRYDAFWDTMMQEPPVAWRASVYGFPIDGMVEDCRTGTCSTEATRFTIKGIDWRSLAMTRSPVNRSLSGFATVMTAKSYVAELIKGNGPGPSGDIPLPGLGLSVGQGGLDIRNFADQEGTAADITVLPKSMDDALHHFRSHLMKDCPHSGGLIGVGPFSSHFQKCCGASPEMAEIMASALLYKLLRDRT